MSSNEGTRKRNAPLPRTYTATREYMHHRAKLEGKTLIQYIEDKAAPQRSVNAFIKARTMQDDESSSTKDHHTAHTNNN